MVHLPDQILDYGSVYNFWAFLSERLNKVLKNLNVNNWGGGQLEVSMMRQYLRATKLDTLVYFPLIQTVSGSNIVQITKTLADSESASHPSNDPADVPAMNILYKMVDGQSRRQGTGTVQDVVRG